MSGQARHMNPVFANHRDVAVIQGLVHGVDKFMLRGDEQQANGLVKSIHDAFFPQSDWGPKPQPQPRT